MSKWLKDNWAWALAGGLFLVAMICLAIPVRSQIKSREKMQGDLRQRKEQLTTRAGRPHPNERWIEKALQIAERVREMRDFVAQGISDQRRDFQTRRFYLQPYVPQGERQQIIDPVRWLDRYRDMNRQLEEQSAQIGLSQVSRKTWGQDLPRDEEITDAMTLYWLQKDLIDILTNNEVNELELLLQRWGGREMATAFDLLRNNAPGEPRQTILRLAREERISGQALREILLKIITEDVASFGSSDIRETLMKYRVVPDQGAQETSLWELIIRLTTSPAQRNILDMLQRDNDWRHLFDYAMDIKKIRLRSDLISLFEASREDYLVEFLRNPTPGEVAKIRTLITRDWDMDKVIQILNTIVAIDNREIFDNMVSNHGTPRITLRRFAVTSIGTRGVSGGEFDDMYGPGPESPGVPSTPGSSVGLSTVGDLYYVIPVTLSVDIEFEKLPLLMRRLYLSDWSISVRSLSIQRAADYVGPGTMEERDPGMPTTPIRRPGTTIRRPGITTIPGRLPGTTGTTTTPGTATEVDIWQRRVSVDLECEVRWFLPLKQQREAGQEGISSSFNFIEGRQHS